MGADEQRPRARAGAAEEHFELLYRELRRLAANQLRRERVGHTLQPTALVHEAYVRLAQRSAADFGDARGFFRAAARAVRHILVDHARKRSADKRVEGRGRLALEDVVLVDEDSAVDLLVLNEALEKLGRLHARQAELVELRFFAGRSTAELARWFDVSTRTIEADWAMAKAFLREELGRE